MTQIFISVIYTFLVVTYLASAGTEGLSSFFKWRSRILFRNVKNILNDDVTGLAIEVYRNALVHPRSSGDADSPEFQKTLPSYIDPKYFANALISALGLDKKNLKDL